ncbi:hypothetical protein Q1695_011435 [Nippostrongylus brasiliensis]|nr:hypothetical protein Q1695_011435 [Nippostrongylus brasiliensis]
MAGFHLVVAIAVNLVSVLALLGLVNAVVFYLGDVIGYETWSVENGLQYLVFPLAYIMGVSGNTSETLEVAGLISTKTVVNEFVAYRKLGEIIANNRLSARSAMIATYALCGFSNFCSVGIVLAVLGGLAPSKRQILARTIFRALVCGCICCLYTAAVAGVLVSEPLLCRPSEMASKCFNLTAAVSNTSVL